MIVRFCRYYIDIEDDLPTVVFLAVALLSLVGLLFMVVGVIVLALVDIAKNLL